MNNPLRKRYPRELRAELGKYLVICLLLVISIGFVSGFLVADNSMIIAYNEGFEKYNVEDGHFETKKKMNAAKRAAAESNDITVYDMFYKDTALTNGSTLRFYSERTEVNTVCVMSGRLPSTEQEVAIDRMYADNNNLSVGDTISDGNRELEITGLVALPDYSCLFEDNSDTMFDAILFGVGIVTEEGFESLPDNITYSYAWKYNNPPTDEAEEKELSDDLLSKLNSQLNLEEYIPRYSNQAIQFTGEDMGGDRAMMTVLLYIVMVIVAFVFALTMSDTINREANVIGTLRASGYTKSELVRHYMFMPMIVTAVSALIGNALGYTYFLRVSADLYYGSYSLPTFEVVWNADAFLMTTVVPILLMLVINYVVLRWKLRISPLRFIRRDLQMRKNAKPVKISSNIPFFTRFQLRVILQNKLSYLVMLVGILFVDMLLIFGLAMPSVLNHYMETVDDNMLANHQYILRYPIMSDNEDEMMSSVIDMLQFSYEVRTDNPDAEKFSAYTLQAVDGPFPDEEILLYGIEDNSRYVKLDMQDDDIVISTAYADKFRLGVGDTIRLKEKYEETPYEFRVTDIYDYDGGLVVFMPRKQLNRTFDLGVSTFGGYFSDSEITDIDEKYIGTVIDFDSLTKVSRQLERSMGGMMGMIKGFAVLIFLVVMYLLTKVLIEKNEQSISMTKILGYSDREISKLYIVSTTVVVMMCLVICVPLESLAMRTVWFYMMRSMMSGWVPYYSDPIALLTMFALGAGSYLLIAILEFRRIRRIPKDVALKNVE